MSEMPPVFVLLRTFEVHGGVVRLFQIEDIRNSIDKIDENVAEVKKLYSVILSAPTSDQSKRLYHDQLLFLFTRPDLLRVILRMFFLANPTVYPLQAAFHPNLS